MSVSGNPVEKPGIYRGGGRRKWVGLGRRRDLFDDKTLDLNRNLPQDFPDQFKANGRRFTSGTTEATDEKLPDAQSATPIATNTRNEVISL